MIGLKRARNSLLNISTRVPPEILGSIFIWRVVREGDYRLGSQSHFDGLRKGSYSFLLVCHHWFEVASRTPELWGFWGNALGDWNKRYRQPVVAPLDLVLDEWASYPELVPGVLHALRDRATQDMIRKIHLRGQDPNLLASIVSSLTPDGESSRGKHIESIIFKPAGRAIIRGLSEFFARSRLPKLRYLDLDGALEISSLDHLSSQITRLTTLSLSFAGSSPAPTTSKLMSNASNPNLRELVLVHQALPDDVDKFASPLPLRHLR